MHRSTPEGMEVALLEAHRRNRGADLCTTLVAAQIHFVKGVYSTSHPIVLLR